MIEKLGTVVKFELGSDQGNTWMITFRFNLFGSQQGFGGGLGRKNSWIEKDFIKEMCTLCQIDRIEQMKGMKLIALYEDTYNPNSFIIGIKNPKTGATWLLSEWMFRTVTTDRLMGGQ